MSAGCGMGDGRCQALKDYGGLAPPFPRPCGCQLFTNFLFCSFFFPNFLFFFCPGSLSHMHIERALNVVSTHTVFRRHYASVGRLGPFPATPRRITENRRPPRRGEHCKCGRPLGARPPVRWRCPRRCVVTSNSCSSSPRPSFHSWS